jgi:hypothetical protein
MKARIQNPGAKSQKSSPAAFHQAATGLSNLFTGRANEAPSRQESLGGTTLVVLRGMRSV